MKRLVLSFLLFIPILVFSQQVVPVTEYLQFNGRFDFTAFGNTLNTQENGAFGPCIILTQSSADFQLDPGQTFISAHLYWAGSGSGDFNVKLNGTSIVAQRTFALTSTTGLNYFSAYSDVTDLVALNGQGTYTLSDLDLNGAIGPYCAGGTNFGGWAIIVIYEDPAANLNQITLFDGLDYVDASHNNINITLNNISAATDVASKIGFLAWEGDAAIANNESLRLNGTLIDNPPLNPGNNAFNSTNSYTGSYDLYNMDLDFYELGGLGIIQPGDDHIDIQLSSGQDFIMVNNIVVTVNSELPDATITIDNLGVLCEDRNIEVNYTVANANSTALLPANTPIAFYADAVLLGQTQTVNDIPIDGTESGTINLNIPVGTPQIFTLKAVVDDDGTGNGIVLETNESNNEYEEEIDLTEQGLLIVGNNESCVGLTETLSANFDDLDIYNWFFNGNPFGGNTPTIDVTQSGSYTVSGNKAACFVEESPEFIVTFNPQPVANAPVDIFKCDNGTQTEFFDLTQNDGNVLGTQDPAIFEVKYFTTEADSENNTNAITTPGAYPITGPTPQTIYVRIHERVQELCYDLAQFKIYYTPVNAWDVPPFTMCDQDENGSEDINLAIEFNAFVLNNQNARAYNITYHSSQNDADSGADPLPNIYSVPVPGQTIFIRIEPVIDADCYDTTTVEITVDSPPTVNNDPTPLIVCDTDNDGYALFNLHDADDDITGGDGTLVVTYHPTQLDAQNDLNELFDPYTNDDPYNDVVFARVEGSNTTCYATVRLQLIVRNSPTLIEPTPMRLCDDNTDGLQIFDLTTKEPEMLGTMDPLQYDFYYYEVELDAVAAGQLALTAPDFSASIPNPFAYQNTTPFHQIIYVLAVGNDTNTAPHNGGEGCYDIVPLELFVDPIPVPIQPLPYELCDDLASGSDSDQISTFDLTTRNLEITGGDLTLAVTWFETHADEAADNPIPNPRSYRNRVIPPNPLNPMTIVARVTNNFGCSTTITLTLVVNPLPVPAVPTPLEVCDDNNNGFAQFDLTEKDIEITNGEPDVTIRYYTTRPLAEIGSLTNQILGLFTNGTAYFDIVWARVERNSTGCYAIVPLELIVNPIPGGPIPGFGNLIACDADGGAGAEFDLTQNAPFIYGTQSPDFILTYHTSLVDAQEPTNAILNPTAFTSTGQTIWVRLEDDVTGCARISSFELIVSGLPIIVAPENMALCDDLESGSNTDGISTFNLTSNNTTITGGNNTLTVRYYETVADQQNNNPITNPTTYTNPVDVNGQGISPYTLHVTVFNVNGCSATTTLTLVVLPVPSVTAPTPLIVCDTDNDGFALFNLHDADAEITGGNPTMVVTYHPTLLDAQNNLNELFDPYTNDDPYNDVVFARIEDPNTSCNAYMALTLVVRNSPILVAPTPLRLCDDDTDGLQIFDLTTKEPEMLGAMDPLQYDFYYYEVELDAVAAGQLALTTPDFSASIPNPTAYQNTTPFHQIIYVLAVGNGTNTSPHNGGEGCYDIVPLELFVDPIPVPIQPLPYELCDDLASGSDTDQISTFDLTTRNLEITGGDLTLAVTWYETYADEAADNPIPNPRSYQNRVIPPNPLNPMTIVARVTNNFGCSATITLTLVVNPLPVPAVPTPLEVCDDDNNGFAQFDLTEKDIEITNGEPDVTIRYYTTRPLAEIGSLADQILGLYTNDNPFYDIVWARVERNATGCYAIVPLELIVNPVPGVPIEGFGDLIACETEGASAIFDLTQNNEFVYGTQSPDFLITYHTSLQDAENGIPAIQNPTAFTSTGQTIWVRLEDDVTGCVRISSFELIVSSLPTIVAPEDMELCDDLASGSDTDGVSIFDLTSNNNTITGGNNTFTVRYYETVADQENDNPIANPTTYTNPVDLNGQGITPYTLQVSVFNADGCASTTTLTLVVLPVPRAITPTPLVVCDDDNDGFAEFDLTEKDDEIAHGEPNLTIRYYTTRIRAEIGSPLNEIVGPYTNDTPFNDMVWVRVEKTSTGCFVIRELELIVSPIPDVPTDGFGDLIACDLDGGTSAVFDLTENAPFIYGTQSPDFILTYHISLGDAENGTPAIQTPTAFTSSGQTIWVRLENDVTGCARISSFELIVGEFPTILEPEDMVLCDDLESGSNTDGISIFNLTSNNNTITGGNASYTVRYYETLADQENDNPITDPETYTNPMDGAGQGISPYTLHVSVLGADGCSATTTLTLVVLPVPRAIPPTPLVLCDDNSDGFGEFDLTQKDVEISNGNPAIVITYHETLLDAENGTLPLASPFQNIVAFSQTIYARATFGLPPNISGCYVIVPLELIVAPSPIVPFDLPDLVECDPDGDGFTEFDLTVQDELIYGDQDQTQLRLTYHISQSDADTGARPITNPRAYTNISNPQEIYVRLAYIDGDECFDTGHFSLIVSDGVPINDPTPLEMCDDLGEPNDMRTVFNLTLKNAEITGGAPGMGVSYFVTEQDAIDNVNRIDPEYAFENTTNPQRVYVRVTDGNSECVSYTHLLLRVLPNPQPATPTPFALCDETIVIGPGPDDGVEKFDLTLKAVEILNGGNWDLGYFESYDDAFTNENAIPNPDSYQNTSSPQIIYVRVTNRTTGCFEIVELELIVNPLPDDTAVVPPYIKCEFGTDVSIFDLTTKIDEILGDDQSRLDFVVTFYLDPVDAADGVNRIMNELAHQNRDRFGAIENPQTIYTGIRYIDSECYIGGVQSFELIVQEGAVATTPAQPFAICDNLAPSDGFAEFDLEDFSNQQVVDLRNEILTGQDPLIYSLAFYETMDQAMAGSPQIVFPFTNTINPQVVYARVTNEDDIYDPKCFEIVEVILKVEELPRIYFDDQYRLCVDANGNPIAQEDGSMSPPVIDTGMDPALYTFEWMHDGVLLPGANGPSIIALAAGEYTVTVTEIATGCEAWETATVVLSSPPLTYSATDVSMAFSDNHTIEVAAEGLGVYEFQLDNGPFQDGTVFENVPAGSHTITIRDVNGCGSVTLEVGIVDYPPYFTPNGDGYHDTWNIIGINFADPYAKIYIFDRFGKLLKQLSPSGPGWDGTYSGNPLPSSDYWFRVDYMEGGDAKQFKGHFTLKR